MKNIPRKLGLAALVPFALTACGSDKTASTPTAPPAATTFEAKFGSAFASTFDAPLTADPIDPTTSTVPALDLTKEPLDN